MVEKKIAIFEEINSAYYPLIKKYLRDNFIIYYFKKDKKLQHIESNKIIDISKMIFDFSLTRWAAFNAHENVDYFFDKYYSSTPSLKLMKNLLNFPKIEDMYKKEILFKIERIYNLELKINDILKNHENINDIHFISFKNFKIHADKKTLLKPEIKIIQARNLGVEVKNLQNKLKKTLLLCAPVYRFLNKTKKITRKQKRKKFKIGITIDHPKNIFLMKYYTETIFIDDKELPKKDVLFIDEKGEINVKDYKERDYNYTRLIKDKETISWDLFWNKIIKLFLPIWTKTFFLSLFEDTVIIDINYKILSDYIKWNIFTDNYNVTNYVKRGTPDNISKIHILSQSNTKTWFIFPNNFARDVHTDWDEQMKNITFLSFIYYDNAAVYGNLVMRHFQKQRNFIKKYYKVGVMPSQIVCELQEGKLKSELPMLIEKKKLPKKIIGVFDTYFADHIYQKAKDGIKFGNDILKLLDEYPDIGIIFKAKKELKITPYLVPVYNKLKNHERCIFLARYDPKGISAPEVIAISDITISTAYTSSAAEALGAKKKAIYYDVVGKDLGDKYYFNKYPNLVAHSYEELKKLINYWLYDSTDEDFEKFLDTYVKDEIDPYLDGKALTRLRNLLMEDN